MRGSRVAEHTLNRPDQRTLSPWPSGARSREPHRRGPTCAWALRSSASNPDDPSRTDVTNTYAPDLEEGGDSPPPGMNSLQQQARFDAFVGEFNSERPHEALAMKTPGETYSPSSRPYRGLPELTYPLHDRDVLVTACGRICMHRKRINVSYVLAGQRLGIKEVDEGIWIVSFMHYDLGYIDSEQKTLQPLDYPFGPRLSPMSSAVRVKIVVAPVVRVRG